MKIAVLDDYQQVVMTSADWEPVQARGEVTIYSDHLADQGALVQRLIPFDVVVAMRERTPFPRSVLEQLPNLKLLVTTGRRNAVIDLGATHDLGITVCGTGGTEGHATVELTWALILALVRHLPAEHQAIREGRWQTRIGTTVRRKRLGVLGLGRLGSQVASLGLAFGMSVTAWSENLTRERTDEVGVELAQTLDTLLRESDIVTIHLLLSERTQHLLGVRELALMKPTASLINTSRAQVVDEAALVAALRDGTIAGAGLDVFETEPLPVDSPFLTLDNVVLAPHIGHVTRGSYRIFFSDVVEDILAFIDGIPVRVITPAQPYGIAR